MICRRQMLLCAVVATLLAAGSHRLAAHDLERTAVSLAFARDGSFVLEVANDPNWLLLRLESFVDSEPGPKGPGLRSATPTPQPVLTTVDRDARLRALASLFIDRIVLFIDGREVMPSSIEYVPPPPLSPSDNLTPLAAFRLRGRVDPDAHILRWYYGMVVDPYPFAIHRADGRTVNEWIVAGDAWSRTEDLSGQFVKPTLLQFAREYLGLGYARVLPKGVEHVLFILGLFLLSVRVRAIVLQVAAFTIAHAIAIGLTTYGVMSAPPRATGAAIALSVAYVALENLATTDVKPWRLALVFLFGLAHGADIAVPLRELALPRSELPPALAWFILGVDGGQLSVIALVSFCVLWYRNQSWYHRRIVVPVSLAIAGIGVYWTIARAIG